MMRSFSKLLIFTLFSLVVFSHQNQQQQQQQTLKLIQDAFSAIAQTAKSDLSAHSDMNKRQNVCPTGKSPTTNTDQDTCCWNSQTCCQAAQTTQLKLVLQNFRSLTSRTCYLFMADLLCTSCRPDVLKYFSLASGSPVFSICQSFCDRISSACLGSLNILGAVDVCAFPNASSTLKVDKTNGFGCAKASECTAIESCHHEAGSYFVNDTCSGSTSTSTAPPSLATSTTLATVGLVTSTSTTPATVGGHHDGNDDEEEEEEANHRSGKKNKSSGVSKTVLIVAPIASVLGLAVVVVVAVVVYRKMKSNQQHYVTDATTYEKVSLSTYGDDA